MEAAIITISLNCHSPDSYLLLPVTDP